MLTSITPLGERGRGNRWWLTVSGYVLGSLVAGTAMGALLGGLGALLPLTVPVALALLGVAAVVALAVDLEVGGLQRPTIHRQVDDAWRDTYRGWVWGLGYGLQLGLGVVTIVTSSTVYLTWLCAVLTGSVAGGALVGAAFGLARAVPVLGTWRVHDGRALRRLMRRTAGLAATWQRAALGMEGAVAVVALVSAVATLGR